MSFTAPAGDRAALGHNKSTPIDAASRPWCARPDPRGPATAPWSG